MPWLPVPALGLESAALHEATALVTAAPWLVEGEGCDVDTVWAPCDVVGDPASPWEMTAMAVPPPAATSAAANAAPVLRLNASGIMTSPPIRNRRRRRCTDW
jgi:hypothetical protein